MMNIIFIRIFFCQAQNNHVVSKITCHLSIQSWHCSFVSNIKTIFILGKHWHLFLKFFLHSRTRFIFYLECFVSDNLYLPIRSCNFKFVHFFSHVKYLKPNAVIYCSRIQEKQRNVSIPSLILILKKFLKLKNWKLYIIHKILIRNINQNIIINILLWLCVVN